MDTRDPAPVSGEVADVGGRGREPGPAGLSGDVPGRGEVWWARLDGRTPVVLLPDGTAIRVVAPATAEQRRGFVLLSGAEAADDRTRERILAGADPAARAAGAEVAIDGVGVVRVAFPRAGRIFCTWETALTEDDLIERLAVLPAGKTRELEVVLRLARGGASSA